MREVVRQPVLARRVRQEPETVEVVRSRPRSRRKSRIEYEDVEVRRPVRTNQFEVVEEVGEPVAVSKRMGRDVPVRTTYEGGREYRDTGVARAGAPLAYQDTQSVVSHHTGEPIGDGRVIGSTMVDRRVTMQDGSGRVTQQDPFSF